MDSTTSSVTFREHFDQDEDATNSPNELRAVTRQRQLLVLISGFLTICITIGLNQSYGVFQSYYISPTQTMLPPSTVNSSALVAFVGTVGYGLTWAGSIVINPILSRISLMGIRILCSVGVVMMSLGFGLASVSTQIWQLLLTQGLLYGAGSSMLYFPIMSAAPEYFNTHRGSAMGFILSGAGVGGLVFSPLIRALISEIGPRWTLRLLSLLVLVIALPIAVTAAPSRFVGRRPSHINIKLALKPAFLFSVGAAFLQAGGNGVPLTFLSQYSIAVGFSASFGATLLAISSGVNSISRLLTGWIADKYGRQNTMILTVVLSAISVLAFWLTSTGNDGSRLLWIFFVVFYGVAGAGYNALFPTTIVEVFGLQAYASINGFIYFVRGLGTMFGSPVGGKILGESTLSNYRNVIIFDAALLGGAAFCVIAVRMWDALDKRAWKWKT